MIIIFTILLQFTQLENTHLQLSHSRRITDSFLELTGLDSLKQLRLVVTGHWLLCSGVAARTTMVDATKYTIN